MLKQQVILGVDYAFEMFVQAYQLCLNKTQIMKLD